MLHILSVGTLPPHPGGSSVSSWQVLRSLQKAGHSIHSISAEVPSREDECREFDASLDGIESFRYRLSTFPSDMANPIEDTLAEEQAQIPALMDRLIAQRRPDVILVGRDALAPSAAATAARHRIPWVLRSTGHILHTIEEGRHAPSVSESIISAAKQADMIALQGVHLLPLARRYGYSRLVVIPNFVDGSLFTPQPRSPELCAKLGIDVGAPIVVHASNLKPVKREIDVVESAPAILESYPATVFVIVGDGGDRPMLENRCRELGITESFRFPGWIPYSEMPRYLALADVVVMPSEFEQQAGVYLETQACGRTLLASDIPAAREVVQDGYTGLLFRVADPEDLAQKAVHALANPELRQAIGTRSATEVLVKHSLEKITRQFENVMWTAVEANRSGVAEPSLLS